MFRSLFLKWKPGSQYFIPLNGLPLYDLRGPYAFLHPGYDEASILLDGKEFLAANGMVAHSCAHAFYACLMPNPERAYDVIISSSTRLAREKAQMYGPRKDWTYLGAGLMEDIYYARFDNSFNDRRKLSELGEKAILPYINGSTFWGTVKTPYGYKGFNLIGKCLMRYRSWLIDLNAYKLPADF